MIDETICPFCGSGNTETVDWEGNGSQKRVCRDCNRDCIAWFEDEDGEICSEITDRHGRPVT